MLQILRRKAQSTFIQIIVVIIALVFIFWGVGTNLMKGDRQAALTVNGEDISFAQYQQAYERGYQRLSQQFGGSLPKNFAESFGLKQQIINQLVQNTLLRQGAAAMGIVVSNKDIRATIENMEQFKDDGKFSMDRYKAVLAANRLAPTKFEKSMRVDRLSEVAAQEIARFAAITTDYEIQDIYGRINEKVAVNFVRITPKSYLDQVKVDDKDLAKWFDKEKDNYKSEPQLKLQYLTFTFNDVASQISVDEKAVEDYYRENINKFQEPEKRQARHILFKATEQDSSDVHKEKLAKAEEVQKLAISGKNFADLAKEYSEGPSKNSGGELGWFSREQMVAPFSEAVFTMKQDEISKVVQTTFGYHIILLEGIKPATTKKLSEVKDEIVKTLQQQQAQNLAFQMANEAYEGIIAAGSLTAYQKAHPQSLIKDTDFFTKENGPDFLKNDNVFLTKAFELQKGELSSLIKGDTGYAIFLAQDTKEPVVPDLATIKEKVNGDYRKAQSKELAQQDAKKFLDALKSGKKLDETAREFKLDVNDSGFLTQNNQQADTAFPKELYPAAFQLTSAKPYPEQAGQTDGDFYVFVFKDRQIPLMPQDKKELEQYKTTLLRYKQQQLVSAWLSNMQSTATVTKSKNL